ncbi:MAG: heavy-metal-associated domain-containing protein [Saprospiraceae bacterium]|nr:heavy-metal-associated domain-containing protein [Saprospiraceae bacterium]
MRKIILIIVIVSAFLGFSVNAQGQGHEAHNSAEFKNDVFTVYGNCGMCERTIEGSLKGVEGVTLADWDKETDQMTVSYNPELITLDAIKQKVADVGYDSDTHRAKDEVYNSLPGCCQYDRPKS